MKTVKKKPWGKEIKFTETELPYTGKILYVLGGKRLSLQKHTLKTETIVLYSGDCLLQIGEETIQMEKMTGYTIKPLQIHRITAVKNSELIEFSSPETGKTIRIEDDFSRENEKL